MTKTILTGFFETRCIRVFQNVSVKGTILWLTLQVIYASRLQLLYGQCSTEH